MMALSKNFLEVEITKAKAALKALDEGIEVNKIVLKAFEEELKNA